MRKFLFFIFGVFLFSAANAAPIDSPTNKKYASLVVDVNSGKIIHKINANKARHPASLTKMMTVYLMFDAIKKRRMGLNDKIIVSYNAATQPRIRLGLKNRGTITVREAILALIVRSANDVATAVAEHMGRTEERFARRMTAKARALGMKNTVFKNASGLHDEDQITTAKDMARLSIALRRDFPEYYHFFKMTEFRYNGKKYTGHNKLVDKYDSVDGLKTGYVNASGFNLASSVKSKKYNLVAVVMGGKTSKVRDKHMVKLINSSISFLSNNRNVAQLKDTEPAPTVVKPKVVKVAKKPSTQNLLKKASYTPSEDISKVSAGSAWGVQVGAFRKEKDAYLAVVNALNTAKKELKNSEISLDKSKKSLHRARIVGLDEKQARAACYKLQINQEPCFVFKAENDA